MLKPAYYEVEIFTGYSTLPCYSTLAHQVLQAQTKEELEELKNSAPLSTEGKGSKKGKVTTTANGEKVRELPEPTANKFGKNKRLAKQLFGQG